MNFNFIINPETGRKVKLTGNIGKMVIKNYIKEYNRKGGKRVLRGGGWQCQECGNWVKDGYVDFFT